jgi:hypothetical protein
MRKAATIALAGVLATFALGACGSTDESTPVACLEGSGPYLKALDAAPGAVTLDGETPISGCLTENQTAGDLTTVGEALVVAATKLSSEARRDPGGRANLELGYLVGAAQRGADGTEGIHSELIRRLVASARYSPDSKPLPAPFLQTYERGFGTGRTLG